MKKNQFDVEVLKNACGGAGAVTKTTLVSAKESIPHIMMINNINIPAGSTVGVHQHNSETETYYIIKGKGEYNDNGSVTDVKAGDVLICYRGDSHGISNTGESDLEFIEVIGEL